KLSFEDERFNAGRKAGVTVNGLSAMKDAVVKSLVHPQELSYKRKKLIKRFLYNPGRASEVAAKIIGELLES
ncbi:MAG: hypothetical protein MUO21_03595, partial [Nitrososphaeraceae archaeon]|nr:hypothetical protein [Nitrososphaeraceae archaeon]